MKLYASAVILTLVCSVVMIVTSNDCLEHSARAVCEARYGV